MLAAGVLEGAAALTTVGAATLAHAAAPTGGGSAVWVRPDDPRYEQAVAGFNTTVTRPPEAVVLARHPRHVQHSIRHAVRHDLPVAVLATGHQASVSFDGGILVSTAAMNDVNVDRRPRGSVPARGGPRSRRHRHRFGLARFPGPRRASARSATRSVGV